MISHKHKCIFIHIPRTGGTSIEKSFPNAIWKGPGPPKHYNASEIRHQIEEKQWKEYFKFTFIRNPWERIISRYFQPAYGPSLKGSERQPVGALAGKSLKYFLTHFEIWASESKSRSDLILDFINPNELNFIGRFENRNQDLKKLSKLINFKIDPKLHVKKTKHKPYWEYYDEETKEMVYERYKKDIEYFDYKFRE